jgi:hypothetical protein
MSEAPSPKRRFALGGAVGQAATAVGLISGILGLVFIARPGCQPQPPANVSSAEITGADLERGVTFGYYLERASSPRGTLSRTLLRSRGVLVVLHYSVQGHRKKRLPLRWRVFDTDGEVVRSGNDVVRPGTDADSFEGYVWVADTNPAKRYYVVATLLQPDGSLALDSFKTEEFAGVAR